jgi:hypothetical protein
MDNNDNGERIMEEIIAGGACRAYTPGTHARKEEE